MPKTSFDQFRRPFVLRKTTEDGKPWSSLQDKDGDEYAGGRYTAENHRKLGRLRDRLNKMG